MFKVTGRILLWLREKTWNVLIIAGIALLISGALSPLGTLVWWLREGAESLGLRKNRPQLPPAQKIARTAVKSAHKNCYIIFLPGVGDFSADELDPGETFFLNHLQQLHPNCVTVADVFPYSAANKSLGGDRLMAPLWRFAHHPKAGLEIISVLIQIRNLWRFAISADPRYGPVYNQGIAKAIVSRMNAKAPLPAPSERPLKIILLGTSGGVQVSLGAAPYLKKWLNAEITVVSLGGVFHGTNGFNALQQMYHLRGERDSIQNIGGIVFPTRWLWNMASPYNQARLHGRYKEINIGPQAHDGPKGYLGEEIWRKDGTTYAGLTLEAVNKLPIWDSSRVR
ncbi:hypothetical protein [Kamptonema formosum]|uniref:hypothetical protein n=1 Tax=Kamptonema formosum TaxID=331992 RepID=UPI00034C6C6F|nr:hypothetical protein [Oscillatoria sp. PCC 10802]